MRSAGSGVLEGASTEAAVWLFLGDYRWETPVTDGLQLILGATGAALLFAGIGGRRPDWIDPEDS